MYRSKFFSMIHNFVLFQLCVIPLDFLGETWQNLTSIILMKEAMVSMGAGHKDRCELFDSAYNVSIFLEVQEIGLSNF